MGGTCAGMKIAFFFSLLFRLFSIHTYIKVLSIFRRVRAEPLRKFIVTPPCRRRLSGSLGAYIFLGAHTRERNDPIPTAPLASLTTRETDDCAQLPMASIEAGSQIGICPIQNARVLHSAVAHSS